MKKVALSNSFTKDNSKSFFLFSWAKKEILVEIISLSYVLLFLYTGLNKIMDVPINSILLAQSPLMEFFAPALAWGIPITEFVVSIALFFPRYRLIGLYAALSLMTIFTSYIVIMLMTSDQVPCSCGGIIQQLSWPQHIIFNLFFIALAVIAIRLLKKKNAEMPQN